MGSLVTKSTFVNAPVDEVRRVILDVEGYPSWQKEMEKVEIVSRDDHGRPSEVRFEISTMGQKADYTLVFSYPEENTIESHLTRGETIVKQDQLYRLTVENDGTELNYSLDISIKWEVPDFMLSAIINKGIKNNLTGIKSQAEG